MAMWLDDFKVIDSKAGSRHIKADIECDTTPDEGQFPLSGANVDGLSSSDILVQGSSLFAVDTRDIYFLDSTGHWK